MIGLDDTFTALPSALPYRTCSPPTSGRWCSCSTDGQSSNLKQAWELPGLSGTGNLQAQDFGGFPLATQPHHSNKHAVTLVDDNSRKASIHGLRDEPQVGQALSTFTFWAELSAGQKVKVFRSNSGGERMTGLQEVPHHAAPLHDISPTHTLDSVIPDKALSGNKPSLQL